MLDLVSTDNDVVCSAYHVNGVICIASRFSMKSRLASCSLSKQLPRGLWYNSFLSLSFSLFSYHTTWKSGERRSFITSESLGLLR